jgi:uncharacterized protein (DUF302 family)
MTPVVELSASGDADQVEERLREALDEHGLQLFARIDHAAGARKADVELEANVLLIFGNPSVGTPLMQADPRVGVELPLRMLIWQDPDGTHVGYLDPRELADRYALDGHEETLERQGPTASRPRELGSRATWAQARPPSPAVHFLPAAGVFSVGSPTGEEVIAPARTQPRGGPHEHDRRRCRRHPSLPRRNSRRATG